jgi:hypothetical protein
LRRAVRALRLNGILREVLPVSAAPEPQVDPRTIEQTRQQINRLRDEVARLSESDIEPGNYYGEFLMRVLTALAAPAGAIWLRTSQGNLQLQYQIQMQIVGLDRSEEGRQGHDELLRQGVQQGKPVYLAPHSSGPKNDGVGPSAGNPTDYLLLLVPIVLNNQVTGLVEVWQAPDRHPSAIQGFMQFLTHMAELAARYMRHRLLGEMTGQQQLWTQLESFSRQVHASLNPIEVAYVVANEGRRLIDCDRVSVGIRQGKRTRIEAISGADVVEKRSNLVQRMRTLVDSVIKWSEKLIFTGVKDDSLPPDVYAALDAYLEESASKLLVVMPLKDTREEDSKKPVRSALVMECFEPAEAQEQLIARMDIVGKHAAPALYNAVEHRRIPFRFVWMPFAAIQEGLGGKARAIVAGIAAGVALLLVLCVIVPYPLKMDANGQFLPEIRRYVYSPVSAHVARFAVEPGMTVHENQDMILMRDLSLQKDLIRLNKEIEAAQESWNILNLQAASNPNPTDRVKIEAEMANHRATRDGKLREREALIRRTNSDRGNPGFFWIRSPEFPTTMPDTGEIPQWTVLTNDFREVLSDKEVKPSDPLLRVGYAEGHWEIELKIPQKHIGQVLGAFGDDPNKELDVDILLRSEPTKHYRGKLARHKIAGEANPNRDDNNESEPVVLAWVRIDGNDIPESSQIPRDRRVTGTEVHAKIRCGNHAMGYSLFYGVWEFFYEKVVFFF